MLIDCQTVRFYDAAANEQKAKFKYRASVLSCLFGDSTHAYSRCFDTEVREYVHPLLLPEKHVHSLPRLDLSTEKVTALDQRANTVSTLSYAPGISVLLLNYSFTFAFLTLRC
jgi:cell cycle arrest protein BUB3